MKRTLAIVLLATSTMVLDPASGLWAQAGPASAVVRPLLALAHNDLSFGYVLPGVPSTVNVHDPRHAALFEIQGPAEASVRVELLLPSALRSAAGDLLPVSFGPEDGYSDFSRGRPPRGTVFDPHGPLISSLGPNGKVYVRLGGTVTPARPQASGVYSATIFLTVFDLGS